MRKLCLACAFLVLALNLARAQAPAGRRGGGGAAPLISPEVLPDRTVTFRLRAPAATNVVVSGSYNPGSQNRMTRGDTGVWSVTVGPLAPNIYSYSFSVDGFATPDTANPAIVPAPTPNNSMFEIPADSPQIYDFQAVPHGTVSLHTYASASLGKLRSLRVYTPPDYEKNSRTKYPVLYLLHGSGDTDATWSDYGRAHLILDNLLAAGKIVPMIVVMPEGHAAAATPANAATNVPVRNRNLAAFEADLLGDIIPLIERNYRVRADREHRAIIGLSMGGGESLSVGLRHLELFAWVGGMSSATPDRQYALAGVLANPKDANKKLHLLWIACGRSDSLLAANKQFDELLTTNNIKHQFIQTDGAHEWPVWRRNLADFTPLIFSGK